MFQYEVEHFRGKVCANAFKRRAHGSSSKGALTPKLPRATQTFAPKSVIGTLFLGTKLDLSLHIKSIFVEFLSKQGIFLAIMALFTTNAENEHETFSPHKNIHG